MSNAIHIGLGVLLFSLVVGLILSERRAAQWKARAEKAEGEAAKAGGEAAKRTLFDSRVRSTISTNETVFVSSSGPGYCPECGMRYARALFPGVGSCCLVSLRPAVAPSPRSSVTAEDFLANLPTEEDPS